MARTVGTGLSAVCNNNEIARSLDLNVIGSWPNQLAKYGFWHSLCWLNQFINMRFSIRLKVQWPRAMTVDIKAKSTDRRQIQ